MMGDQVCNKKGSYGTVPYFRQGRSDASTVLVRVRECTVMWWNFPFIVSLYVSDLSPSKKKVVMSITPGTQLQDHLESEKKKVVMSITPGTQLQDHLESGAVALRK